MPLETIDPNQPIPTKKALRHLIVFQFKLFVDAFRDLLFSPISLTACIIDMITQPKVKDSLSFQLMLAGRKSDRLINLFDEYLNSGGYTIDETVKEVEDALIEKLDSKK